MKKFILFFIFYTLSFSNNDLLNTLQQKFKEEVTTLHVFKRYFRTYLNQRCDSSDIDCQINYINLLQTWESTDLNQYLQNTLLDLQHKTQITEEYFAKLQFLTFDKLQGKALKENEFISVVDLKRQLYVVVIYNKRRDSLELIGADLISSGNMDREIEIKKGQDHYFKTPSGVFSIKGGWRSDGKYNDDNTTQGYGEKGRFIYYLGKQSTLRYNVFDKNGSKIYDKEKWKLLKDDLNFALHSHKSTKKMGKPYSHGCIRMTHELNYFLDNVSILHKNFLKKDGWSLKYAQEPEDLSFKNYAGEYIVIFDQI
jgi:lipoprotein-anchoring transpeptidase ErfK/SrfK